MGDVQMLTTKFTPNSLYTDYLTRDLNFEEYCYQAAVEKKCLHSYAHPDRFDVWFNMTFLPLVPDEGDLCYCTYTTKLADTVDLNLLTTESLQISSDVIKTCIRLHGTDDFEKTMNDIIKDVRHICKAEVCSLMLIDFNSGTYKMLAKSMREGSVIKTVTQFVNFYDIAVSWLDTIGGSDCLIIKNRQDMEYISNINNPWYLTLEEAGVDSVVLFPLRYNGEVLGFIWATNFATENAMRIKETLELTTFFLSSEIASYKLMKRLEHISYTDLLTGVKNRNAMNNRVTSIVSGAEELDIPYGVVFADLNGLKLMNDTQGHSAGDLLLKKAALHLQEVFKDYDVYRAGGDEFVVIIPDISREDFDALISELRKSSQAPGNISFAVGKWYCESGLDVRDAMRKADEDMYRNKQEYYQKFPERKAR